VRLALCKLQASHTHQLTYCLHFGLLFSVNFRQRLLSRCLAKVTSYVYNVFCVSFCFLPFNASAPHRLDGFVSGFTPTLILVPQSFWELKTSIFGSQTPPSMDSHCTETRRKSGKTKIADITTISRLPSHTSLVKFGSGEFEL